ncbi:PepSY domain-containing protein [Litorilituus lipolyticus]|uniref:PepSY domain-containing protein n=1 Tax=Litorilituus lipolyticus TaxID=2491017 RepID=A0A502L3G6_9GAMM|nr:PepSY domain-containing protein [Litorilituus lipolyticus]TPH18510.1 PepSY domain-containing protein [Litorilituus lipolyticus]
MSWHKTSRTLHKWLMLFVGIQFLIWSISGLYMVVMDIHYIHGDTLIKPSNNHGNIQELALDNTDGNNTVYSLHSSQLNFSIMQLMQRYPDAENIELDRLLTHTVYRFKVDGQFHLINADNGVLLSPISIGTAIKVAQSQYSGDMSSSDFHVSYLSDQAPRELSARHLPVWRIDIDDAANPTLYVSAHSGKVITKRHSYWRVFDWMFAFHVMDYIEESADNWLLLCVSVIASIASFFGLILIYYRVLNQGKLRTIVGRN